MAEKVHASGTLIENEKGEILVLKREKKWPEGGKWGLVGGGIKVGEDSKEATKNKIRAEIGIDFDLEKIIYLDTFHWNREDLNISFEVYKVLIIEDQLDINLDKEGSSEYAWMKPNDLYKRNDLMKGLYPILEKECEVGEGEKLVEGLSKR